MSGEQTHLHGTLKVSRLQHRCPWATQGHFLMAWQGQLADTARAGAPETQTEDFPALLSAAMAGPLGRATRAPLLQTQGHN